MSEQVEALPLTKHAQESHANQTWNATTIQQYFAQGGCIPREYSCAAKDQTIQYCELKPGLSVGIVVGRTIKTVITGFAAKTSYWENRCK